MFSGLVCYFFFKQKTAYEMRISDWSSDVCSSDLDLSVARDYAAMVPDTHRLVGESGLRTKADLDALAEVGVTSFLVGESLMREADVEAATRRLLTGQ